MIDSVAVGDLVLVEARVTQISGNKVLIEVDGQSVVVPAKLLKRPVGGHYGHRQAQVKGSEARRAGRSLAECPYAENTQGAGPWRKAWIKGWMEG